MSLLWLLKMFFFAWTSDWLMNNEPYLTCNIDQVRGQYSNQPHLTSNLDIVLFHQVTCIYTGDFVCVYVCINKYIFCTIVAKNFYGDYVIDMRTSLPCLDFLTYLWLFDLNMRKTWVYVYQNIHSNARKERLKIIFNFIYYPQIQLLCVEQNL